jgi:cellulose synthase/poly-beta-1,6-N-acetylglucosamine synthase-like glycosyltransferase
MMAPWTLLLPGFAAALEGLRWPGGLADRLVFLVLFCALVDFTKLLIELLGRAHPREFGSEPALVTAVIASRNGAGVLAGTIGELRRSHRDAHVLVIDDGSTDGTGAIARELGCEVHRFEKSKGKASAINYAVYRVRTPLVLLLDDDTRLGGARLPTSLIMDGHADAVAFRVLPDRRNRDGSHGNNFLGALQRYEYAKSMEIGKRFHDVTNSVSCVSGAIGLFRTADLDSLHHRHTCVFQGEDFQRTMIHLLDGKRVVFADEPVWTVAPSDVGAWLRQRLFGWYPGLYHQLANMFRLMFRRHCSWRLRYEMAYNVYTVISDPLKTISIVLILMTPGLRLWGLVVYLLYLAFETFPWWVIRQPGTRRHTRIDVLLFYPLYGALNTVLRTLSLLVWAWMRWVTGSMKPRRGPLDRVPA